MTQRVNLYLEDDFAQELRQRKPKSLSLSAFCCWMIEDHLKSLDSVARLATCSAGAGDSIILETKAQQENEADQVSASHINLPSVQEKENSLPDSDSSGGVSGGSVREGKGRALRGSELPASPIKRTKATPEREIRDNLKKHTELIQAFWNVKKGSRSDQSWALLQTELTKIQQVLGDDRVVEQLHLGINGLWKGITMRNLQRFELPQDKAAREEPKHPASRVFTAKDGFGEPAANPALQELF